MIKLSVIVPVYNTEKYLEKCLDSLVNQTLKEIEIVVINDGSTDNSKQILNKYSKKYKNIHVYDVENGGLSKARNLGISKAKGKYIAFLDSDDYIDLDLYEKMFEKTKGNVDIVECDFIWEYENKKKNRIDKLNLKTNPMIALRVVVWNKIYRRDLLIENNIKFPENVYYEDVSFSYKLFPYIKKSAYVPNVYLHYVQRKGSITSKKTQKLRDIYTVLDGTIDYYKEKDIYSKYEEELEYLYMRFLLGSSFLRMVKIDDSKIRKQMLKESYKKIKEKYPNYKKNKFLKEKSNKNRYYKSVNNFTYPIYCRIFRFYSKLQR